MAYNGTGTFERPVAPYVYDTVISETDMNTEMDGIATGLTNCVTRDGQSPPMDNLPMGGYRHTGVGAATAQNQYARVDQVQNGSLTYLTSVGGTADAITATAALSMTAWTAGQEFTFIPTANNTTPTPTLNPNAIGEKTIKRDAGAALVADDIVANRPATVFYNGTDLILKNPATVAASQLQVSYLPLSGGTMTGALNMSGAAINEAEGSAIASAATVDLDTATGNFVHVTGTTTITAVTLSQGAERTVVFDDALTLTNGAGLLLGGANIVTAAGDVAVFRGEGASVTRLVGYQRADQRAIQDASTTQKGAVALASQSDAEGGTESTKALTSLTLRQGLRATGSAPIFACRGWVLFDGRGTVSITASGNVSSITDNGTGDYTINFTTALPDANYAVGGTCLTNTAGAVQGAFVIHGTGSSGSTTPTLKSTTQLRIMAGLPNSTGAADMNSISVMVFR